MRISCHEKVLSDKDDGSANTDEDALQAKGDIISCIMNKLPSLVTTGTFLGFRWGKCNPLEFETDCEATEIQFMLFEPQITQSKYGQSMKECKCWAKKRKK